MRRRRFAASEVGAGMRSAWSACYFTGSCCAGLPLLFNDSPSNSIADRVHPMSRDAPAALDVRAARHARLRAIARGSMVSVLATEVASRMDERLDLMRIDPRAVLVAGQ